MTVRCASTSTTSDWSELRQAPAMVLSWSQVSRRCPTACRTRHRRVAETQAIAVVVPPTLLIGRDAQAFKPTNAVRLPGCDLAERELVVRRRFAKTTDQSISCPQQHTAERRGRGDFTLLTGLAGVFKRPAVSVNTIGSPTSTVIAPSGVVSSTMNLHRHDRQCPLHSSDRWRSWRSIGRQR